MRTIIVHSPAEVVTREMMMDKTEKVTKSLGKDITDYPIEEAQVGLDGEPMFADDGSYKKTGRTFEWSIKAGETVEFPSYVAQYLKGVYSFLELQGEGTGTTVPQVAPPPPGEGPVKAQPVEGGVLCSYCGKTISSLKGYGLHLAHAHPEALIHNA